MQTSLPVKAEGLGFRKVSSLALPTFLASAASTLALQSSMLSTLIQMHNLPIRLSSGALNTLPLVQTESFLTKSFFGTN